MRQILPWVNINGITVNKEKKANISAFDDGFINGYGVFTTMKVRAGLPLFLDRHIIRLQDHTKKLNIPYPQNLEKSVSSLIEKNKLTEGGIRITISPETAFIHPFPTVTKIETVRVITTPETRGTLKTIKTTYRVPNILAQKEARVKGAQDAIFTLQNQLIESTYANIYILNTKSTIITPPIAGKGLNGISRQVLMENLPIQEQKIPDDTIDPMILVSSLSMRIVKSINGRKLKQDPEFIKLMYMGIINAENKYIEAMKRSGNETI